MADPPGSGTAVSALRRPSWGHQTTLFQLREPSFWLFAVVLLVTGYLTVAEQNLFRQVAPGGWALSWFLLAFYAIPVFLVVYLLDLYEREPLSLVLGSLLWGGIAATQLSAYANTFWGEVILRLGGPEFAAEWTAALTAPFIEETMKYLGVVLVYLIARGEVDDLLDGFVFGAMSGLGFAVVEDVFYFIGAFGGDPGGVLLGFYVRVIGSGLYTHVLWTAVSGMGLAYFVSRRADAPFRRRLSVAAGLLALAMLGHFLWNSPLLNLFPDALDTVGDWVQILFALAVKGVPMLAFVVAVVRLAHRREARLLRSALATEVGHEGLTAEELDVLADSKRRRAARRDMARRAGPGAAGLLKRLHRAQINLAMISTRVGADHPDLVRQRQFCKSLRDALTAMPAAAPAAAPPPPAGGPAWVATHRVPPEGLPAWATPDPSTAPTALAGGLDLALVDRRGDWALVRASNGWTGWVDARRLVSPA
ncbi:MAG: PrsW family intramembrane metalloprotease [Actinobacteria bacterium]|nr:PrsW family intramembrane metalloprotease [Actinomycetota bacterium]